MKCVKGEAEFRGIVIDGIEMEDKSNSDSSPFLQL